MFTNGSVALYGQRNFVPINRDATGIYFVPGRVNSWRNQFYAEVVELVDTHV